ncbi:GPI-anchored surface protein, putative, partial [Bodo saltans]
MLRAAFCVAFALAVYLSFSTDTTSSQGNAANITYVSGTCKKTTPDFNMSTFYNQESMLVSSFDGIDITGSDWDLGRDGAFVGYNVFFCAPGNQPPDGFFTLIEQKGFSITRSCNTAGLLTYPAYHVFIIFDYVGDRTVLSTADAIAIRNFYVIGGGIYALTDNCPHFRNANVMYNSMPHPINKFYMRFNNAITPYPLRNGNPVGNNQFGHHPTFTGIPELSAGHSLSIPYYDGQLGIGVFAPMATIVI